MSNIVFHNYWGRSTSSVVGWVLANSRVRPIDAFRPSSDLCLQSGQDPGHSIDKDKRTPRRESATGTLRAELQIMRRDQVWGCIREEERAQDVIHYRGHSVTGMSPEKWVPVLWTGEALDTLTTG